MCNLIDHIMPVKIVLEPILSSHLNSNFHALFTDTSSFLFFLSKQNADRNNLFYFQAKNFENPPISYLVFTLHRTSNICVAFLVDSFGQQNSFELSYELILI